MPDDRNTSKGRKPSCYVIAEAGVNHNGSLDMALRLIDAAVDAGADAVKFQTFKAEHLASACAPKAEYQMNRTDGFQSQLQMLKGLELDAQAHEALLEHCRAKGIEFLSTPFDHVSLELLVSVLKVTRLKLSSGDLTNSPLLLDAACSGLPVILSTGMATLGEIEAALGVLAFGYAGYGEKPSIEAFAEAFRSKEGQRALLKNVTLLHCTTEYPAPYTEINLKALDTLRAAFGLPVGYSDHSQGIEIPIAATALGGVVIEKHFTLDRALPGPDHAASLEPDELVRMVRSIRNVEAAMGTGIKLPTASEAKNCRVARKSLVASTEIAPGDEFTPGNLTVKRPGNGMSPHRYWEILGKKAVRRYQFDEMIDQ